MYISFVRPTLQYANIVWDNCTQYETNVTERIQIEAARIVTGESLRDRRYKHKMCQLYKMINDLTPTYLTSLVP